ncbi:uncharacterized protein [Physcomitrium patens]|uniref:Uncharacterized protein n=2 Tax=Physcomitrium patens TaxID=3218 RepID=A0A2K1JLY0_PHYPA|nr:zinc finger with UFM1-specific peptidase domain protein-like [Physcomitrium patens]XP_024393383.1 zinc finger with UFM1-specific peptidase domain protein-like [Physcomitrium patens]PNR42554.1 hypothetical protein PHYPA_017384 [Physcomitrium patens]|eukprot:XP_024393382.1 zinc finger with UFM1-specific peptidase domain protein-like [Physcomitrella patens]
MEERDQCPLCNRNVPVVLLDSHVNSHLDAEDIERDRAFAQKIASTTCEVAKPSNRGYVTCDRGCNQDVPIQEWDFHCLQHSLTLEDTEENSTRSFIKNIGGLSKRQRGNSYGEDTKGEMSKSVTNRSMEEDVKSLMSYQVKETTTALVKEGLMHLLKRCLESEHRVGQSTIVISGWVDHYESRHREDLGWGCGWRNIQMMASHLLMTDPYAREVLFGGCGFVPDILSLQRWVEMAWKKGFDTPGADYFNWDIVGTHKWIGTTECATLLRSFGIRARIVDFQSIGRGRVESRRGGEQENNAVPTRRSLASFKSPDSSTSTSVSQSRSGSRSRSNSRSASRSRRVSPLNNEESECKGCGEYPIEGVRYRHSHDLNSDLCVGCMEKLRNSSSKLDRDTAEGYVGVDFEPGSCSANPSNRDGGSTNRSRHKHIVDWVWNYFMERPDRNSSSAATVFDQLRQPIVFSKKSPLYFQHRGHSRTIVGIEKRQRLGGMTEEINLFVLDPSQKTADVAKVLRDKTGWQRLLKCGLQTLMHAEYQLCYVDPGLATGEEYENLKVLSSLHFTY